MGTVAGSISLNDHQFKRLITAQNAWERYRVYRALDSRIADEWFGYLDKSFNALDFCLTNEDLNQSIHSSLKLCLFGGQQLFPGNDPYQDAYIISGKDLSDATKALFRITEFDLLKVYERYNEGRHFHPSYIWSNFQVLRDLYRRSMEAGRVAILFSTEHVWVKKNEAEK